MTTLFHRLTFGSPPWLWGLLALPVLAGLFLWAERQATRRLAVLIRLPRLRAELTAGASATRRRLRYALLLAGMAGLLVAMAGPRLGEEVRETHRRGLDLVVIVDVSKSMLATDLAPNRLTRAKLSVQDLVGQLTGDRLGLVAFAGSAFLQAPLTIDYDAVLAAAAELDTSLIPRGGTNIGGAIDLALEAFGKAEAGNRAIVLLTDGEPTSDTEQAGGVEAAGRAAAAGVKIITVGLGTPEGSLIPLDRNGLDFVRDEDGKIVRSRLNESGLREVAGKGNGFYVRFTDGETTMRAVVAQGLSQLKAGEIDARTDRRPIERYQWPLGAGLLFLALGALVGERRKVRAPAAVNRPAVAAALAGWMLFAGNLSGADAPPALDLYRQGRYDDAYRAFEEMAKKNPDVGSLQFNAGTSAYMGKQYDEALDAFGRALTSDNADLQAKSHYNFGNTLYRRGEEQKDREAKVKDWKNAIQHYNTTLETLKRQAPNGPLTENTTYNRDLVQKRLDEEMKQPPQQQPDKDQQKQQNKQDKQNDQKQQNGQNKQDEQQGQQKQDQSKQGDKSDQSKQDQQPPQQSSGKPQNQDANQPPQNQDGQSSHEQPPDPSSIPNQDQPRQRGDFQSQGHPSPTPGGSPAGSPAEPQEEAGKMNPSQAKALLDSLKGEDDRVMLNGTPDNRKRQDEPVTKDW